MGALERVCSEDEVPPGQMKYFNIKGNEIVLINEGGSFYALHDWCTHEQGDLSTGTLKGYTLKCPEHGAEFDIRSGRVLLGPDGDVPSAIEPEVRYEASVNGGDVYIMV